MPDGSDAPGPAARWVWSHHHAVASSVDGELRIMDLSLGDDPVPLGNCVSAFVEPGCRCELLGRVAHDRLIDYWIESGSEHTAQCKPEPSCGYAVTPPFTFDRYQQPGDQAELLASVPSTLVAELEAFLSMLQKEYGLDPSAWEAPLLTSRYDAGDSDSTPGLGGGDTYFGPAAGVTGSGSGWLAPGRRLFLADEHESQPLGD